MKRLMQVTVLICVLGVLLLPVTATAQIPFGGPITLYNPICQTPPATWLVVGPPTPMNLMYVAGTFSYPFGPPAHPGQYLLGIAGAGFVPCIIWVPCPCPPAVCLCPIVIGGGSPILFHGSSV